MQEKHDSSGKRLLRLAVLWLFAGIALAGLFPSVYLQAGKAGLLADDFRYGDLYRLANLPQFKQKRSIPCPKTPVAHTGNTDFYAIGDSFMEPESMDSSDFVARTYTYIHWTDSLSVQLHPARRKVLLIETVEREVRNHFTTLHYPLWVSQRPIRARAVSHSGFFHDLNNFLTGPSELRQSRVEERLENLLFGADFFNFFREIKARLTLDWFGRTFGITTVTPDGRHLLISWDIDTTRNTSNFNAVSAAELDTLVAHANAMRQHYLQAGFDEVLLSVIPNKTTVVNPPMGRYNRLLERLETHPALQVPLISVRKRFMQSGPKLYQRGDSHWNCEGRQIWLEAVNRKISEN